MEVRHDEEGRRFVTDVDGREATLSYSMPDAETLDLEHTEVPSQAEGKGVGSALVRYACEYARKNEMKVIPTCAFVNTWLERHDDYGDVIRQE
jgi:predicted GNAT family acetyltransferase